MGSESEEALSYMEQPVTRVRISRGFYLGKYEVTQGQWQAVMGSNPSFFDECGPDCPVEGVSWDDVQEFIRRLNAAVGEERYRLPTEAEWEYAARAGTSGDRYGNLDAIAWYDGQQREHARIRWGKRRRTRGGSMTCWGTCGSGRRTGMAPTRAVPLRTLRVPRRARTGWLGAVAGAATPGSAGPRFAASYLARLPPPLPRLPPAEDRVALGSITLLPYAKRRKRAAGSRAGGRHSARAKRRTARPAQERPPVTPPT